MSEGTPTTRWEQGDNSGFAAHFSRLIASGADIEGEARLADAMLPRGATVLDAGAGFGRVGAALQARGHHVVAAEKDPDLVAMASEHHPDLPMLRSDILALTPELLAAAGHPTSYDLVVLVGNVIVLLAPDTERRALSTLEALLADGGRILVGFHLDGAPTSSARAPTRSRSSAPTSRQPACGSSTGSAATTSHLRRTTTAWRCWRGRGACGARVSVNRGTAGRAPPSALASLPRSCR